MVKIDFRKFLNKKSDINIHHRNCISPHKGWYTLVWVVIFSGFMLIVFSLYLFSKIKNDTLFNVKEIEEVKTENINQKLLEKILDSFKQKELNREKLTNGEINFSDPS